MAAAADPYASFSSPVKTPAADPYAAFSSPAESKKADEPMTWGGAALKAIPAAANEVAGAITGAGNFLASLPEDPLGYKIIRGVKALPGAVANAVGDVVQYNRNMSPPAFQGKAPKLGEGNPNDHPFLAALSGDTAPMKNALATRPLSLVADAAMVAGTTAAGRAALGDAAGAVTSVPRKILTLPAKADKLALPVVDAIKDAVATNNAEKAAAALDAATAQAAKDRRIAKGLKTTAAGQKAPDIAAVGTPADVTDIGKPLQQAAVKNQTTIENSRKGLDTNLRTARDAIVADNEAKGVTIAQTPSFKELTAKLDPVVNEDLARGPDIARVTDPNTKRLYQRLWDTVMPRVVELTPQEATAAAKDGMKVAVTKTKNGLKFTRTITPSFDAVDDARRFLGEVFSGKPPAGYEGIAASQKRDLYRILDGIQKDYVGSAQGALQKNWREAAGKLDVFDTKAGKTLTATQGDTGVLTTNAADIPGAFYGKGKDRFQHLIDVTGDAAAAKTGAKNWLATQMQGKTAEQVNKMLSPGSKTADMLAHPELRDVRAAAAQRAQELAKSEKAGTRATNAMADSEASTKAADAAAKVQREAYSRAQKYDTLDPRELVRAAKADVKADFDAGKMSKEQFDDINGQIAEADRLHGKTDKARKIIKRIAIGAAALGAGTTLKTITNHILP